MPKIFDWMRDNLNRVPNFRDKLSLNAKDKTQPVEPLKIILAHTEKFFLVMFTGEGELDLF